MDNPLLIAVIRFAGSEPSEAQRNPPTPEYSSGIMRFTCGTGVSGLCLDRHETSAGIRFPHRLSSNQPPATLPYSRAASQVEFSHSRQLFFTIERYPFTLLKLPSSSMIEA
jgi:hypothetical protein